MDSNQKRGSTGLALKAGFWYVVSNFLVRAMGFLTTPIFSRLMSKADYGEFSNYASWQAMLIIITGAELHSTLARAYYDFKEDYDKYISTVTAASCGITSVVYIFFLLSRGWIYSIVSIPERFVHVLFFTLMFQACKSIYLARERTYYRYKSVAVISVFNLLIPTLISVFLVMFVEETQRLGARIYGFYLPSAVIGLGCALLMLMRGRSFELKYCKYAFRLSIPLLVHYFTAHLLTSTNTIVTKNVLGAEAVSVVSLASSANHILTILLTSLSGAVTTWLMDNMEQGNVKATRRGTLFYVGGISLVAVGVILLSPEVVWILGGKAYASSTALMPGMVVSALIQSVTTIYTIMLTYQKRVVKTALYTTVVAVICILAKVFLLPVYGVMVLPFINMACFAILYFVNYILVRRSGCGKYVNFKGITAILLIICFVMAGSYYLYEHTVIRYAVIAAMAVVALTIMYKYRAVIIKLVKSKFKKKKTNV